MKLRQQRTLFAILFITLLTLYFLGGSGGWLQPLFYALAKIQLVPALLSGMVGILAFFIISTLLKGRFYCSIICPFGILMDIITWIRKWFKPRMISTYSKEKRVLRLSVLGLVTVAYLVGVTSLLSLLDPFSAFGRIATHLFRPVYVASSNLLTPLFKQAGNEAINATPVYLFSLSSFFIALATLLIIGVLAALYGRTWCNTLCPVGTVLGYLSKFSLYKIRIDQSTCISCGQCERVCKASCIDNKNKSIDDSRCVACYDCLDVCKFDSIRFGLPEKKAKTETPVDESKRRFMGAVAVTTVATASLPALSLAQQLAVPAGRTPYKKKNPLSPPGSIGAEHLQNHCTACHLCVSKCPYNVLKPSLLEYGIGGFMQPVMDFTHGYCDYDCTICSGVCPNKALVKLFVEEKHELQVGRAVYIKSNCVVVTDGSFCGACSEVCPTQAIQMVPYVDSLTIPSINPSLCVGCGGCEYICPAVPIKAMYVEGNPIHTKR